MGLFTLLGHNLPVPSYTQIQRWAKKLSCRLKQFMKNKTNIDIDSTGLKVYGEGEWKVKKHGQAKHRTWRKLHIASDSSTLAIHSIEISGNDVDDAQAGIVVIKGIDVTINSCAGDGAYDKKKFRNCLVKKVKQLIPPQRNAVLSKDKSGAVRQRDASIKKITRVGGKQWKTEAAYHKRSLSEVNMYRYKTIFGEKLKARKPENEK